MRKLCCNWKKTTPFDIRATESNPKFLNRFPIELLRSAFVLYAMFAVIESKMIKGMDLKKIPRTFFVTHQKAPTNFVMSDIRAELASLEHIERVEMNPQQVMSNLSRITGILFRYGTWLQ